MTSCATQNQMPMNAWWIGSYSRRAWENGSPSPGWIGHALPIRGANYDRLQSTWPWRDWVIRAFNANMPFDQFTIEQLAGDLLPKPTVDQLVATGFNRFGTRDGCVDGEESPSGQPDRHGQYHQRPVVRPDGAMRPVP